MFRSHEARERQELEGFELDEDSALDPGYARMKIEALKLQRDMQARRN